MTADFAVSVFLLLGYFTDFIHCAGSLLRAGVFFVIGVVGRDVLEIAEDRAGAKLY